MFKTINNIKIEYDYQKIGKKTIVFLHGFLGNLNSFSNIPQTFQNFGYSTLCINLTDFGFKNLPKNFTIYDYAHIVFCLIKTLKIRSYFLVGHSFGGRIAIILSSMQPKNIEKIVLVDSAGIKPKFNFLTKLKILKYKFSKFLVKKKWIDKKYLEKFGSCDYKLLQNNMKSVFINVVNEDLTYLLKNINIQTLIIFGKKDKDTPIFMAKKLHKKIKNSTLVLFDHGHFCYIDEKQKFIACLKKFFN